MMNIRPLLLTLLTACCFTVSAQAATVTEELNRVTGEVAALGLGLGDYTLGATVTEKQKALARDNTIKKSLEGTYKFKDGEIFVIAANDNDTILGLYKEYTDSTMKTIRSVIGGLMMEHGEPTAMAHNKLIYWTYDKHGKISQDVFDFERDSGGAQSLAAVKFSSSEMIVDDGNKEEAEEKTLSAYLMITSDPLSKLFLAQTGARKK